MQDNGLDWVLAGFLGKPFWILHHQFLIGSTNDGTPNYETSKKAKKEAALKKKPKTGVELFIDETNINE